MPSAEALLKGGISDETSAGRQHRHAVSARRCGRGQGGSHPCADPAQRQLAILAAEGNEKYLILPEVLFSNNPNVDADDAAGGLEGLPLNRRHPLHVLVHLGVPGADGDIAVMSSAQDPCAATGNYVNG